jgi:hypothetical protein
MTERNEAASKHRDLRFYTADAYEDVRDSPADEATPRVDVNRLVGADAKRLEPTTEDCQLAGGLDPVIDRSVESLTAHAWPPDSENRELGARRILEQLAERKAPEAAATFQRAISQLIEPVRTVAVSYFYGGAISVEATARQLHTSVETVEFLTEVALMYLEPLVEFKSAHVRTPHAEPSSVGPFDRDIDLPVHLQHLAY